MKTLQKTAIALAVSGLFATAAFAQTAPAAAPEAPEASPVTANVTVVNDYRYRGITQTNYQPAIQGGFDYAHESGLYIGNWNSTINWVSNTTNNGIKAPIEMDFYGGFKKELIAEGFASNKERHAYICQSKKGCDYADGGGAVSKKLKRERDQSKEM